MSDSTDERTVFYHHRGKAFLLGLTSVALAAWCFFEALHPHDLKGWLTAKLFELLGPDGRFAFWLFGGAFFLLVALRMFSLSWRRRIAAIVDRSGITLATAGASWSWDDIRALQKSDVGRLNAIRIDTNTGANLLPLKDLDASEEDVLAAFVSWQRRHQQCRMEASLKNTLALPIRDQTVTTRTVTHENPHIISDPSLGFANFLGDAAKRLMEADRAALAGLFRNIPIAERALPKCDVLFLYCGLETYGRLPGASFSFRDIIQQAGAQIAVLASDIPEKLFSDHEFTSTFPAKHAWPANVVISLDRRGEIFGRFFHRLFTLMHDGVTMPMAWNKLAPQIPGRPTPDAPHTIALLGIGHIAFGRKQPKRSSDMRATQADRF